jgi:hypothetical protein
VIEILVGWFGVASQRDLTVQARDTEWWRTSLLSIPIFLD